MNIRRFAVFMVLVLISFVSAACTGRSVVQQDTGRLPRDIGHVQRWDVPRGDARGGDLEALFRKSRLLFRKMNLSGKVFLTWEELKDSMEVTGVEHGFSWDTVRSAKALADRMKENPSRVQKRFRLDYSRHFSGDVSSRDMVLVDRAYVPSDMASMWHYLIIDLRRRGLVQAGSVLTSGYRSPAYQFYIMSRSGNSLSEALKKAAPPFFSGHGNKNPDVSFRLSYDGVRSDYNQSYKVFCLVAEKYGFEPAYPGDLRHRGELRFRGVKNYYSPVFLSDHVSSSRKRSAFARQFWEAMQRTEFYPRKDFLAAILSLADLESGYRWNPPLSRKKKREIRDKYKLILPGMEMARDSGFVNLLLPKNLELRKDKLLRRFSEIIDEGNRGITELDLFLWTQSAYGTFMELSGGYGKYMESRMKMIRKLRYEPKTFGIFQLDVNNMINRMERSGRYSRLFPMVFMRDGKTGKRVVHRRKLVRSLCGEGPLDRVKTLELIIMTTLKPRFENHLLGNKKDVDYFIIEHLMGDMSTHRTAVQKQLNRRLGAGLVLDGDLSFYKDYSDRVDYTRTSSSQKALRSYAWRVKMGSYDSYVREICEADSWKKLKKGKLYRSLMRSRLGQRNLPTISSALYGEKAASYIFRVRKKMEMYR